MADTPVPVDPQAGPLGRAAGIMFRAASGRILLLKRGNGGDYPNHWAFPGGHVEDGESPEDAARREVKEETGYAHKGELRLLHDNGQFAAFVPVEAPEEFPVTICPESDGFVWTDPARLPDPLHPGVEPLMRIAAIDSELAVADLIRDGVLNSPQVYGNVTLFALRITGTGVAWRSADKEYAFRDPEHYLNDEFLRRCNGLPVIWIHPERTDENRSGMLTSEEYGRRSIGTVFVPYVRGDEVWAICKIYDADAIAEMRDKQLSTSPGVILADDNVKVTIDSAAVLLEDKPFLLDHLAVCQLGVWDKGGLPSGVDSQTEEIMSNLPKLDAEATPDKSVLDAINALSGKLDGVCARMDAMDEKETARVVADKAKRDAEDEAEKKAKSDADAAEMKAKSDAEEADKKAKADAEEKAKMDAEDKAKSDAELPHFAGFQANADRVYSAFGESAPRQLDGERLIPYRTRLLSKLQPHSAQFKDIDLSKLDGAVFEVVEKTILADAAGAARQPISITAGVLEPRVKRDATGRQITEYYGDPSACWAPFQQQARVASFIRNGSEQRQ